MPIFRCQARLSAKKTLLGYSFRLSNKLMALAIYRIKSRGPRIDLCGVLCATADRKEKDTEPLPLRTLTK
ncbi:hypothetical protein EVAR_34535_1 [Eumeta japonica]|uniref:Uncharacterized protein n=1 Tax=Eumeta variegata TaxID=151549 RepID=A0A4C1X5V0_EUMVA|nr:hypothetical protein EVAR_34535_1 [Eumeta japonica]